MKTIKHIAVIDHYTAEVTLHKIELNILEDEFGDTNENELIENFLSEKHGGLDNLQWIATDEPIAVNNLTGYQD